VGNTLRLQEKDVMFSLYTGAPHRSRLNRRR